MSIPLRNEVLVVDDDAVLAGLIALALEDAGLAVRHVSSLAQALEAIKAAEYPLILLDLELAGESGMEVVYKLNADGRRTDGVVLLSGYLDDEVTEEALDEGLGDVIRKPIDLALLVHKVRTLAVQRGIRVRETVGEMTHAHYCRSCRTLNGPTHETCVRCDAPRPSRGWPKAHGEALKRLGTTMSRYRFVQVVGSGSAGTVYRAEYGDPPQDVAIKLITFEHLSEEQVDVIKQEVRATSLAQSPYSATIREVLGKRNRVGIVMDLARGKNLRNWIAESGRPEPLVAMQVMRQVCDALYPAHKQGIVHRDIKPDNIHVDVRAAGRVHVTLLDFGVAHIVGTRTAQAGLFHGTPGYAAPEQVTDPEAVDGRTDIYALGCTFYYMLTGRRPFDGRSAEELLRHHVHSEPPTFTIRDVPLPSPLLRRLNAILGRMLSKSQDDRYANVLELGEQISEVEDLLLQGTLEQMVATSVPNASSSEARALNHIYGRIRRVLEHKDRLKVIYRQYVRRYRSTPAGSEAHDEAKARIMAVQADARDLKHELVNLRRLYEQLRPSGSEQELRLIDEGTQ